MAKLLAKPTRGQSESFKRLRLIEVQSCRDLINEICFASDRPMHENGLPVDDKSH